MTELDGTGLEDWQKAIGGINLPAEKLDAEELMGEYPKKLIPQELL